MKIQEHHLTRRNFIGGISALAAALPLAQLPFGAAAFPGGAVRRAHRTMTCNIRVALAEDDAQGLGWNHRKDACLKIIARQQPDLVGFQEVLKVQADDIRHYFKEYALIGFDGPEMDAHAGEPYFGIAKNPVMYRKSRYELLAAGTYWLSETPLVAGSSSWGTARARHVNWVRLRDKSTGRDFRLVNTHLDHKSQPAREKQIALLLAECGEYQADYPQVLTGDFNARSSNAVYSLLEKSGWLDTHKQLHPASKAFTVHGFRGKAYPETLEPGKTPGKIDFIFFRGPVVPLSSAIIDEQLNGHYPSDHFFVSADLRLDAYETPKGK
ncbi:endonuclease [Pedobacter yulinensis]|uniref:Endonuclease n=1 Tax=Pedobacter yulinensis TaxID=2126353 RepID=A0A2T3HQC8_9SPHI|nr:endonuclease/exonuclease/phosphatase family protein [Pedobacter yulinensis]PST84664.1 endonuclease [Pedobacter yulinensis]